MVAKPITAEQISKAEQEMIQSKNRYADLKARAKNQERKDRRQWDNRRKILAGAWLLAEMQKNADFKTLALVGLDRFLTRAIDRAAFPELAETPESRQA